MLNHAFLAKVSHRSLIHVGSDGGSSEVDHDSWRALVKLTTQSYDDPDAPVTSSSIVCPRRYLDESPDGAISYSESSCVNRLRNRPLS
jgi:hypothetical protein